MDDTGPAVYDVTVLTIKSQKNPEKFLLEFKCSSPLYMHSPTYTRTYLTKVQVEAINSIIGHSILMASK